MKTTCKFFGYWILAITLTHQPAVWAQGTAFIYQGRLNDGPGLASGTYELIFTVYDAVTGGNISGGPLTRANTAVTNGLFTVTLGFGVGECSGAARWMEIVVRSSGDAYC